MKGFWALPAVLRVSLASHATFTVLDDILSYPQYEVTVSNRVLSEAEADLKIAELSARVSPSASVADADASFDLSHFSPNEDAQPASPDNTKSKERIRDYERIRLGEQQYLCSIPQAIPHNDTISVPSQEEQEKELVRATHHAWELLKGMDGSCIFSNTGWWTYSFCFNQSVKQFHSLPPGRQIPIWPPTEDTNVQSFVLGKFGDLVQKGAKKTDPRQKQKPDDIGATAAAAAAAAAAGSGMSRGTGQKNSTETGLARLEQKGELKYMVQELQGGTTCDLTGKARRIEVQFHCHPGISGDRIAAIKEVSTCTYFMVIHTPRLCNDVAFHPPRKDKPNPIRCSPIIADGTELSDHPALARAFEARGQKEQQPPLEEDTVLLDMDLPIYVGDIELGGNRLLASPSSLDADATELDDDLKHISKTGWLKDRDSLANSLVLGGYREKFVATVAASNEAPLSSEKLKELGIKDREANEIGRFRKKLNEMSKGKAWRLDVVETAQGREFRGVIETEPGALEEAAEAEKAAAAAKKQKEQTGQKDSKDSKQKKAQRSKGDAQAPVEEDIPEEGSEEVYKDEL